MTTGQEKFDKFSESARQTLLHARNEAVRSKHTHIGVEHLLLGLTLLQEPNIATTALEQIGASYYEIQLRLWLLINPGNHSGIGEIGLTPQAKAVIGLAVDECRRLNHPVIGPEHILLGIVRDGEGEASLALSVFISPLEALRTIVINLINVPGGLRPAMRLDLMTDQEIDRAIARLQAEQERRRHDSGVDS